jgi:HK97 gp10 family phage protein
MSAFDRLNDRAKKAVFAAMARLAINIQREAVISILHGPKSGVVYQNARHRKDGSVMKNRRGETQYKEHQASAPGEAPASDTGYLASHIQITMDKGKGEVCVIAKADYAPALEFGTLHMAARPFLSPAYHKYLPSALEELKHAWNES